MFYPTLDEVKIMAKDYNIIPVTMEVYADMETPISLFKRFEESSCCFLLESVEGGEKWARYSIIGKNPFLVVESYKNKTIIRERNGSQREVEGNPVEIIKGIMGKFKGANLPNLPRFNGERWDILGMTSYDTMKIFPMSPKMTWVFRNAISCLPTKCWCMTI